MLIQPDKNELGDKRLDDKEAVAKLKEENIALRAKNKIPGQKQLEDLEAARGIPLPWNELIRLMKKLNPSLVIRDGGYPNAIAVYANKPDPEHYGEKKLQYVTGFMKEVLMEYSTVTVDDHGVALRETRGWRTVLLALMKQKLISYADVLRVFGDAMGTRSNRWHEQLQQKELK